MGFHDLFVSEVLQVFGVEVALVLELGDLQVQLDIGQLCQLPALADRIAIVDKHLFSFPGTVSPSWTKTSLSFPGTVT